MGRESEIDYDDLIEMARWGRQLAFEEMILLDENRSSDEPLASFGRDESFLGMAFGLEARRDRGDEVPDAAIDELYKASSAFFALNGVKRQLIAAALN